MFEQQVRCGQLLEAMMDAAVEAGRAANGIYRRGLVQHKADQSPVTAADHAAEAIILKRLAQATPSMPIVAEESVAAGRVPAVGEEFFLVDPLDGTKEFIQRRGDFTVNIALIRAGAPVLGVVYAPASAILYAGDVEAKTAFRSSQRTDPNGTSIDVSAREPIRVRSVPARGLTAVVSRSHVTPETEGYLACCNFGVGNSASWPLTSSIRD